MASWKEEAAADLGERHPKPAALFPSPNNPLLILLVSCVVQSKLNFLPVGCVFHQWSQQYLGAWILEVPGFCQRLHNDQLAITVRLPVQSMVGGQAMVRCRWIMGRTGWGGGGMMEFLSGGREGGVSDGGDEFNGISLR